MNRHAEIETDGNEEEKGNKKRTFIWLPETQPFFFLLCRKAKKLNKIKKNNLMYSQ